MITSTLGLFLGGEEQRKDMCALVGVPQTRNVTTFVDVQNDLTGSRRTALYRLYC